MRDCLRTGGATGGVRVVPVKVTVLMCWDEVKRRLIYLAMVLAQYGNLYQLTSRTSRVTPQANRCSTRDSCCVGFRSS